MSFKRAVNLHIKSSISNKLAHFLKHIFSSQHHTSSVNFPLDCDYYSLEEKDSLISFFKEGFQFYCIGFTGNNASTYYICFLITYSNYCTKSDCKLFQQMEERGEIILTNLRSNGTIIMGDMNKIHCIYVVVDDGCQN